MKKITELILNDITNLIIKDINIFKDWQGKSKKEIINALKTRNINFIETPTDFYSLKGGVPIAYYCKTCGSMVFSPSAFRVKKIDYFSKMLCVRCRRIQTYVEFFGCDNPMKNKEIIAKGRETWNNKSAEEYTAIYKRVGNTRKNKSQEEKDKITAKIKATKLEHFGDENFNNNEKHYQTMLEKYGVKHPLQCKEILEKSERTKLERYNDSHFNNIKKRYETCQKRYGKNNACEAPEVIEKINQAIIASLGVKRPFQSETYMNKYKNTMMNKYGSEYYLQSPDYKRRMFEIYGCEHPITGKLNFYGLILDSLWELAVWIYCIDHLIPIIREPCYFEYKDCHGKSHRYTVDFMINGKLIEIKGDYFFKADGTMYFPFNSLHRDSRDFTPEEKTYYDDLFERKHQCGLQHGVEFWKGSDCEKYLDYCNNTYPGWTDLYRRDNPWNPSYNCLYYINPGYYQPQYYVPIQDKGATPFDKPDKDGFIVKGKGITPYDLRRYNIQH